VESSPPDLPKVAPILLRSVAIATTVTILGLTPIVSKEGSAFWARFARPPHWPRFAPITHADLSIKLHLAAVAAAILVGAIQLMRPTGDRAHRLVGWIWLSFIMATALSALFIHAPVGLPSIAGVGVLHIFSAIVLVSAPLAVIAVRRGAIRRHAATMSSLYTGGLGVAGLFAFLPGRLLWRVFFG
jgi:uncharacterized membrane protein